LTKVTLIDPQTAGISGDMLLGALIDAGASPKKIQQVLDLIPPHYSKCKSLQLQVRETNTHGFRATGVEFEITEDEQQTSAQDLLRAVQDISTASKIREKAAVLVTNSLRELVTTESRLHGLALEETHLHEAGSTDTLADILAVAAACDELSIFDGEIYSTPVAVGGGNVSFSHGTVAVPAPAVLEIARQRNIPIHGGPENVELATPTGMSILANLVRNFVENYPALVPTIVGYGAGKRELSAAPNLIRVVIGHGPGSRRDTDAVSILETNLDDLPGEILGNALQQILDSGAKDAWITPAQFKKNRPGHVLHVICNSTDGERLANIIMEETGTLGVRYQQWNRFKLQREIRTLKVEIGGRNFDVRVKFARQPSGRVVNVKPEFDDIRAIAKQLSIPARKVSEVVLREAQKAIGE
jgi:uncharacterized protein (TIGR00299 family) protein